MANVITIGVPNSPEDWEDGKCEHVEKDRSLAYRVFREDDTFGPVGREVVCRECFDKQQAELHHSPCEDCGQFAHVDPDDWIIHQHHSWHKTMATRKSEKPGFFTTASGLIPKPQD